MGRIETGPIATDVETRHAETIGDVPRIAPLATDALDKEQRATTTRLRALIGAGRLPEVPEYFRTIVKHPALFEAQLGVSAVLFQGTIPARERELAVLRVGWLAQAPYEWGEHVAAGRRCGLSDEEIERVTQGSAAPGWSAADAAILRAVEELMGDFSLTDATWNALAAMWSEQQLLEFPMLVGTYVTTAFQQNMLRMRLTETNPGLSRR